jgi:hypothetical protein
VVYLLQAEEREISYDLLQDLAAVLMASPDVAFADATRKIHSSHGIMEFESRGEAERVSARLGGLKFRTFVVDHLLDPPASELLHVRSAKLTDAIELAAAAEVDTTTEHKVTTYHWLNMRVLYGRVPYPNLPNAEMDDPGRVLDVDRAEETDIEYYLDLFAGPHHWRIKEGSAGPYLEFVKGLALSAATLGIGARNLAAGDRALPRFQSEKDYDRYLKWLYQLRFAER